MRVATFNICHGSDGPGTPVDLERLVDACRGLDADVLALQEVDRGVVRSGGVDQAEVLSRELRADLAWSTTKRYGGGRFGNALLVRGSVLDVEVVRLRARRRGLRRGERRSAVLAGVHVGGRPLTVGSTHLSVRDPDGLPQLAAVLSRLAGRPGPVVLLGDWNLRPGPARAPVTAVGLELDERGGPTFPRAAPTARIDHVAARGVRIVGVEVVDPGCSDHRAVVADLAFDH